MATERIWVKSGRDNASTVFWEIDDAHPGGEASVAASRTSAGKLVYPHWDVAKTPRVQKLLADGELVQVDGPDATARARMRQEAAAEKAEADAEAEPASAEKSTDAKAHR